MTNKLENFVLYNIGWFACVASAAAGRPLLGIAAVGVVAAFHLFRSSGWRGEARLLAAAALIGFTWETLLVWTGLLAYPTAPGPGLFAPAWIVALWVNFAITPNASLAWLKGRPWLAAALGAVGGPLAFLAGERLGAVCIDDPVLAYSVLAAGWAVLMPALLRAAQLLEDAPPRSSTPLSASGTL